MGMQGGAIEIEADGELLLPGNMNKSGRDIDKLSATLNNGKGI